MTDVTPTLNLMHSIYCQLTERSLPISSRHLWAWEIWLAKGFTEIDLRLVVGHIKRLIKEQRRRPESFRFHLLVEDTERFAEDLAEARALSRRPKVDYGKQQVLKATGRVSEKQMPLSTVKSTGDILKGEQALKELLALRDSL